MKPRIYLSRLPRADSPASQASRCESPSQVVNAGHYPPLPSCQAPEQPHRFERRRTDHCPRAGRPRARRSILREAEEEQMLRSALSDLAPRCQDLIRMLFYEEPSRPYKEIAASLGLATGSIGLLRQKCLERLRERLESAGFL